VTASPPRLVALLLALAAVLTACGGGDPEPDEPTSGTQPPSCTANPAQCK